ncbi:uncharacterized protein EHS24_009468 [Apiotrichum porosum]|uniref:Uncharacterized protein n=1 Tax=Apiotrichum porosum TaxID=105984 RepID=A0A427XLV6_9TREE|nr:uncharacterized protein EHS24_009468 [Apiotrichum porosum]RSH79808.1 hypothetical protein EHS24_009468 [Apiotrichum porosum]
MPRPQNSEKRGGGHGAMVKAGVPLSICGNSKQAENRQLRTTVLILSHTRTWALMITVTLEVGGASACRLNQKDECGGKWQKPDPVLKTLECYGPCAMRRTVGCRDQPQSTWPAIMGKVWARTGTFANLLMVTGRNNKHVARQSLSGLDETLHGGQPP